jgi:hypothetical protein
VTWAAVSFCKFVRLHVCMRGVKTLRVNLVQRPGRELVTIRPFHLMYKEVIDV